MQTSLAALFLLAEVFDLEEVVPPDAPHPCENPAPFGGSCRTLDVPLTSDTFISQTQPNTPFGTLDALHISTEVPCVGTGGSRRAGSRRL